MVRLGAETARWSGGEDDETPGGGRRPGPAKRKTWMSARHEVRFEPGGLSVAVAEGLSLLEAAVAAGLRLRSDCGGRGKCGQCRVLVQPGGHLSPLSDEERERLTPAEMAAGWRLACQARVSGEAVVSLPAESVDSEEAWGKTDLEGEFSCDPLVERLFAAPSSGRAKSPPGPRDVVTQMLGRVKEAAQGEIRFLSPAARQELAGLKNPEGEATLVHHLRQGVTAVMAGRRPRSLGLAVDVGTTTLAAYLCDLQEGRILTAASSANPQRRFGEDVISRIAAADARPRGLETLQGMVVEAINRLLAVCLKKAGAEGRDVDEVSVVGNTTMEHLFAGLHPHSLGRTPYLPVSAAAADLPAGDIGLELNPGTNVHLFPVISGFVGGDAVAAALAEDLDRAEGASLVVDIGTNGEVVLGHPKGLWATSCATGPALEGAHISCGVRAAAGAVDRVEVEPGSGEIKYHVLGGPQEKASGICGSGLIDALAVLRRAGVLRSNGRLNEDKPGVISDQNGVGRRWVLIPAEKTAAGREVFISLNDVRQVQLAKAALFVGVRLLLERAGVARVDRLVLTGAFGARFDWRNAAAIGMLPQADRFREVKTVTNAAGRGAIMALLDQNRRRRAAELAGRVSVLELAEQPEFSAVLTEAMFFPPLAKSD